MAVASSAARPSERDDAPKAAAGPFSSPHEAQAFLRQHNVKYVLAQFVDIHGVAKTKSVPVGHLNDVLTDGAGFAGFAVWGLNIQPHDPEFLAKGELDTLT